MIIIIIYSKFQLNQIIIFLKIFLRFLVKKYGILATLIIDMSSIIKKTNLKPPSFLVFCGDKNELFAEIHCILRKILPIDTYTVAALSKRALNEHPWMQYCACLLIADTSGLDAKAQSHFDAYFMREQSRILFVNPNLSNALEMGKYKELFESVFGYGTKITKIFDNYNASLKDKMENMNENEEIGSFKIDNGSADEFSMNLLKYKGQFSILLEHKINDRKFIFSGLSIDELLKIPSNTGKLHLCDLLTKMGIEVVPIKNGMNHSQQPKFTNGYLFNNPDKAILNMTGMTYGKELGIKPKLIFCPTANIIEDGKFQNAIANTDLLPVEVRRKKDLLPNEVNRKFDVEKYYGHLESEHFGRALLYVPVCTSTMDISESISCAFPSIDGTLVVAGHQTAGRGRIGNEWLCADGAAMFNLNLNVPFQSNLGRSIVLLQHLMAVSICNSISQLSPDFPIKIKWPNDLYYGRISKFGGVLVRTSQSESDQKYSCLIGVGLNVANSKPTICINDMLPAGTNKLDIEQILALIMNNFEVELANFQENGKADLIRNYYKFWLHSDEEVTILRSENGHYEKAIIKGLDDDGYLLVRNKETGQNISLQSDGNSFDLFQGLIIPKSM